MPRCSGSFSIAANKAIGDEKKSEKLFELNAGCDEWQNDASEAQEKELAERKAAAEMFWFIQKRRQQGDWG